MRVEVPFSLVWGFLQVFARIAALFAFLPLPGLKTPVDPPRILLAVFVTLALSSEWPTVVRNQEGPTSLAALALGEMVFGLLGGMLIGVVIEVFQLTAQLLAQQAGFSYASTIDPTNDTDSGVLLVLCQLLAGFLAICAGLDRYMLRLFARSLDQIPAGTFAASLAHLETAAKAGKTMFEVGLLLALPSIAIFLVLDVLLAVLSRLEQQLQLTSILFPVKTASAVLVAAIAVRSFPAAFERMMASTMTLMREVVGF